MEFVFCIRCEELNNLNFSPTESDFDFGKFQIVFGFIRIVVFRHTGRIYIDARQTRSGFVFGCEKDVGSDCSSSLQCML